MAVKIRTGIASSCFAVLAVLAMTILALLFTTTPLYATTWKKVVKGLDYTYTENIHAFKIDLKEFQISLFTAKDIGDTDSTATMLAKKSGGILAINGGFFGPTHKPLGLLIRNGRALNPMHGTKWWGIFYIDNDKPFITLPHLFALQPTITMALQAGPRLVVGGKIPKLKEAIARRSGIGIRKNGEIVIAITDETPKTMQEFAEMFRKSEKEEGFDCPNVLNLDGGRSSQLSFDYKGFKLEIPGIARVTNVVTVFPR